MVSRFLRGLSGVIFAAGMLATFFIAQAQSFGVVLNNTLMTASGGMAGTSIARP